jgi:hypothetical protein
MTSEMLVSYKNTIWHRNLEELNLCRFPSFSGLVCDYWGYSAVTDTIVTGPEPIKQMRKVLSHCSFCLFPFLTGLCFYQMKEDSICHSISLSLIVLNLQYSK